MKCIRRRVIPASEVKLVNEITNQINMYDEGLITSQEAYIKIICAAEVAARDLLWGGVLEVSKRFDSEFEHSFRVAPWIEKLVVLDE